MAGNPQGQGEHRGLFQLLLIGMNLRKEILSALAASLAKYRIADYGNTLGRQSFCPHSSGGFHSERTQHFPFSFRMRGNLVKDSEAIGLLEAI